MLILGIKVSPLTFTELKDFMVDALKSDKKLKISKSNGEFLIRAHQSKSFQKLLNDSDLNIPDGIGVLWSAKYLSLPVSKNVFLRFFQSSIQMIYSGAAIVFSPSYVKGVIPERLSGIEVFYTMLESCISAGSGVYFFGARPEVLESAIKIIREKYPKLKISGYHHGYGDKGSKIISDINKTDAKLLIVALGSPEQEQWISDNLDKLKSVRVAVGEGGSFDAIAGTTPRAPKIIQKVGMEWLWRGIFAPNLTNGANKRLLRIWNAVPVFIFEVVKWKIINGATNEKS
jgi:N-acetylglucosaminyldiphosphoundecaprenol N-acetyl-beta-D-mannosaminyltransferase